MSGEISNLQDLAKLMDGKKAQMAFTSPPNISTKDYEINGIDKWKESLSKGINNLSKYTQVVCFSLLDLYQTSTQFIEPTQAYAMEIFAEYGLRPIWIRVWKKGNKGFGVGGYEDYKKQSEKHIKYINSRLMRQLDYLSPIEYLKK